MVGAGTAGTLKAGLVTRPPVAQEQAVVQAPFRAASATPFLPQCSKRQHLPRNLRKPRETCQKDSEAHEHRAPRGKGTASRRRAHTAALFSQKWPQPCSGAVTEKGPGSPARTRGAKSLRPLEQEGSFQGHLGRSAAAQEPQAALPAPLLAAPALQLDQRVKHRGRGKAALQS